MELTYQNGINGQITADKKKYTYLVQRVYGPDDRLLGYLLSVWQGKIDINNAPETPWQLFNGKSEHEDFWRGIFHKTFSDKTYLSDSRVTLKAVRIAVGAWGAPSKKPKQENEMSRIHTYLNKKYRRNLSQTEVGEILGGLTRFSVGSAERTGHMSKPIRIVCENFWRMEKEMLRKQESSK